MKTKLPIALALVTGLAAGGAGMYFYQDYQDKNEVRVSNLSPFYDRVFDDSFFKQSASPFEQMEKMREEMDKLFPKFTFDNWYGNKFGGKIDDIKQDEDQDFVYYRIDLKGMDKDQLKVDVANGHVSISGTTSDVQAQEEKGAQSRMESYQSFERVFPVPMGVDEKNVKIENEGGELVIKFPKKSATVI